MSRSKIGALVMTALLAIYVVLLANTGIALLVTGILVAQVMGVLILSFPLIGVWAIVVELKFGLAAERLVARVEAEGTWPDLGIETRPSGRAIRSSADVAFKKFSDAVAKNENDWHAWFTLSLAYDACGDRRRARGAMRKALTLSAS